MGWKDFAMFQFHKVQLKGNARKTCYHCIVVSIP